MSGFGVWGGAAWDLKALGGRSDVRISKVCSRS